MWKVRPWIEMHRANLELIRPAQNQSVDEVMVPFKGRSHLKQFMRNKPHRWGFKLWARTGSDGILHDWDVYQGSANKNPKDKSPLGLSGEVVMKMAEKLPQGKNFKIYADNFFSSLQLVKELKEKSIWYVGTVRENRLKGCSLKPEKAQKASEGILPCLGLSSWFFAAAMANLRPQNWPFSANFIISHHFYNPRGF